MSSMYGGRGATGSVNYGQTGMSAGRRDKIPSGYQLGQLQQFTPEQMQLFQSMFGHLGPDSFLSKIAGGDEAAFGQLEAPALRQFSGQMGNLASRFSGMGTGGRHSSGFQNAATQAGSEFAQNLQSQRMGLQSQALRDLMGMSESLLGQRPYEKFLKEKPDFMSQILGGAGDVTDILIKLLPFFI